MRCCRADELGASRLAGARTRRRERCRAALAASEPIVGVDGLSQDVHARARARRARRSRAGVRSCEPVRAQGGRRRLARRSRRARCWAWSARAGSGKTTLGRAILRLIEPDRGAIRIAGETVSGKPQSALVPMRRSGADRLPEPGFVAQPAQDRARADRPAVERFRLAPSARDPGAGATRCSISCGCRRTTPSATRTS